MAQNGSLLGVTARYKFVSVLEKKADPAESDGFCHFPLIQGGDSGARYRHPKKLPSSAIDPTGSYLQI